MLMWMLMVLMLMLRPMSMLMLMLSVLRWLRHWWWLVASEALVVGRGAWPRFDGGCGDCGSLVFCSTKPRRGWRRDEIRKGRAQVGQGGWWDGRG